MISPHERNHHRLVDDRLEVAFDNGAGRLRGCAIDLPGSPEPAAMAGAAEGSVEPERHRDVWPSGGPAGPGLGRESWTLRRPVQLGQCVDWRRGMSTDAGTARAYDQHDVPTHLEARRVVLRDAG